MSAAKSAREDLAISNGSRRSLLEARRRSVWSRVNSWFRATRAEARACTVEGAGSVSDEVTDSRLFSARRGILYVVLVGRLDDDPAFSCRDIVKLS